jgi:hypothetical protein
MPNTDIKQEILEWLQSETPDIAKGLELWGKYGKNKALDRVFFRASERHADKLRYELAKVAGLTFAEFNAANFTGTKVEETKTEPDKTLPKVILRIVEEIKVLFAMLTDWNKQLVDLPDNNDEETVAKAAELGEALDAGNARYQQLHDAKEKYYTEGVVPNEEELFPVVDETDIYGLNKMDGAQLVTAKKNLESSLTKDRNMLLYGTKKKQDVESPLPDGDERTAIELRVADKTARLEAINALLDAGKAK